MTSIIDMNHIKDMDRIEVGAGLLTVEMVEAAATRALPVSLRADEAFVAKIERGAALLDSLLARGGSIYGVTTGYGDSCTETVPPERYRDLPVSLTRFHGCGLGRFFDEETTRAILLVRLNTLACGYSGVSYGLLRRVMFFIEHDILPRIPEEGSVGASGDLTPLSYIAGALIGEREVMYQGSIQNALGVLNALRTGPYRFRPKEAIAIMNGTAVMNALAARALVRAARLAGLACEITAMNARALRGNAGHFSARLFDLKPHDGQTRAAARIRAALDSGGQGENAPPPRIQDQYSIRCAPHVIGVYYDAEPLLRRLVETEMNSANDNPLVDPETGAVYHGGHFYGGHICFAMDSLKNLAANIADLLDRQLALLVDVKSNRGLAPNLTGAARGSTGRHGFKAVQIAASAWTAEALKLAMPASVFSRSTECHNQDKVSMGTIAARDALRVLELAEQVAAAGLLAATQALSLRGEAPAPALYHKILAFWRPLEDDRPLDADLRRTLAFIREYGG